MTEDQLLRRLAAAGIRVPPSGLLRRSQVEAFFELSHETLRKWRAAGVGPRATRLGGQWFYDVAEIARHLSNGE